MLGPPIAGDPHDRAGQGAFLDKSLVSVLTGGHEKTKKNRVAR